MFPPLVLAFCLQAVLLVVSLNELVLLTDLQNDHLNPHECARRVNRTAKPRLALLAAEVLVCLLSFRWFMVLIYGARAPPGCV